MSADYRRPTHLRLLFDIWSMKLFVWLFGQNGELLDSHLFFSTATQSWPIMRSGTAGSK